MNNTSKLGPREYVFISILFIIPVAMFMFVFSPRSKASAKMHEDTLQKRKQLDEFRLVRDEAMSNINKDIAELEKTVAYLDKRVPQNSGTDKPIGELSRLAREHGLRRKKITALTSVLPRTTELKATAEVKNKKKKEYEYRELMVELEGDFKDFYSFLQAVESFPRIIHVERMRLFKTKQEGRIGAELKLRIFFRQDKKEKSS